MIEVSAPNKHPYRTSVELGKKGDKVEVAVPELHDVDAAPAAKPAIARDSAAPDGGKKAGHFRRGSQPR